MAKLTLICLCVVAASLKIASALPEDELEALHKALAPIVKQCSTEHGVSSSDIESAKQNKEAQGVDPCFIQCILAKTDIMTSDYHYNADVAVSKLRKYVKDDEYFKKFENVARKCSKVNKVPIGKNETICDRAMMVMQCVSENKSEMPL